MTSLQIFDAGENALHGSIPSSITKLENLQELWLEFNYMTGELPADIEKMKSIGNYFPFAQDLFVFGLWGILNKMLFC